MSALQFIQRQSATPPFTYDHGLRHVGESACRNWYSEISDGIILPSEPLKTVRRPTSVVAKRESLW